jgi:Collagen triple helix repeat (20 copies)
LVRRGKPALTYANVTATIALVLAMSGSALAATHYLITSTRQISPAVLKSLKGNSGPAGAAGAAGPLGAQGPQGTSGTNGTSGSNGTNGTNGHDGPAGPPGSTGPTGHEGAAGHEGPPGHEGATGREGATGHEGHEGKQGPAGESAAYAHVLMNESTGMAEVDQQESSHFEGATVTEPEEEAGVFCISGLKVTPRSVEATVDTNESGPTPGITATIGPAADTECAKETQVTVETFESTLGENKAKKTVVKATPIGEGFYIAIN